jgi:phenylacetic acid degradation operon negative regulatory protein
VPETRRELRHQLRTRLTWAGFGSPAPGVWVSPHPAREGAAKQVVEQLGLDTAAFSFTGPYAGIGSPRTLVDQAWHLADLTTRYAGFVSQFAGLRPEPGDPMLLAQVRLLHEWRRFPMLDPELPAELLPPDWIGARAAGLFTELRTAWNPRTQHHWAAQLAPLHDHGNESADTTERTL